MTFKTNYDGIKWDKRPAGYATGMKHKAKARAHNIISDTMDLTQNPIDGKYYDSKSRYYQTVKANGMEICDDPIKSRKDTAPGGVAESIKRAYYETQR